ncbi:hypothetical protein Tco_0528378 [Tanacetum coccineum]
MELSCFVDEVYDLRVLSSSARGSTSSELESHIDEFYPNTKAARQDKDANLDALELARGWIFDLDYRLEESEAREAALERRMRVMEECFGLPDKRH